MTPDVKAQREDELFDVVDGQDRVVRQATRAEVHAQGWWHRAVHVLVFDRRGRLFLQRRSKLKDTAPGCWDSSCAGHLDAGEDYDQAAVRELREELGLEVATCPPRWLRLLACDETGWEFVWVYRLQHDGPFCLHPVEIDAGEWFTPAEVSERIAREPAAFARAFLHLWPRLGLDGRSFSSDPREAV